MLADQPISNSVQQFLKNIHFYSEEEYRDIITLKAGKTNISIFKTPKKIKHRFL